MEITSILQAYVQDSAWFPESLTGYGMFADTSAVAHVETTLSKTDTCIKAECVDALTMSA